MYGRAIRYKHSSKKLHIVCFTGGGGDVRKTGKDLIASSNDVRGKNRRRESYLGTDDDIPEKNSSSSDTQRYAILTDSDFTD